MTPARGHWGILATFLFAAGCSAAPASVAPASHAPASPTLRPWPSSTDLETIREAIYSHTGDELLSLGFGNATVVVGLRAGAVDVARQIVEAYGPGVDVTVGFFKYPSGALVDGSCGIAGTIAAQPALRATLETANSRITSGGIFNPTVRITNVSASAVSLDTSSGLPVYLFHPGGANAVGALELGTVGTGLEPTIQPGMSVTIPGAGGTASCDLSLGYVLPPGPYQARALVDFGANPEGGIGPLVFWSEPFAVEIVPGP